MYNRDNPFNSMAYQEASQANAKAQSVETQVEYLSRDVERLLMITEALWRLLQKAHGYADEDLKKLIAEIDLRDGVLNGRVAAKTSIQCPACNRVISAKDAKCMYCGQAIQPEPFAR